MHSQIQSIPLEKAAKLAGGVHVATIRRWASQGIRGGIRLDTWLVGGRRHTSRDALDDFMRALNDRPVTCNPADDLDCRRRILAKHGI